MLRLRDNTPIEEQIKLITSKSKELNKFIVTFRSNLDGTFNIEFE